MVANGVLVGAVHLPDVLILDVEPASRHQLPKTVEFMRIRARVFGTAMRFVDQQLAYSDATWTIKGMSVLRLECLPSGRESMILNLYTPSQRLRNCTMSRMALD